MTLFEHLQLIKRNLGQVLLFTVVIITAGVIIGSNNMKSLNEVTIFLSISVQEDSNKNSLSTSYDDVQAADHFTETIQGWFKNPIFNNNIKSEVKIDSLSAERQEKQNLFINYALDNTAQIEQSVDTIKKNLNNEIDRYNQVSGTDFQIALFNHESGVREAKTIYLVFFLLILGITIGIAYAYLSEYLHKKIQSDTQLENIFGKLIDEKLQNSKPKFKYIPFYLQTQNFKKIHIIAVGYKAKESLDILKQQINHENISTFTFPESIDEDIKDPNNFNILVIKLGKTTVQDVKMIKKISHEQIALVTIS